MIDVSPALAVAESQGSPEQNRLRQQLEKWYLETHQQDKAGEMREREGLHTEAIELYLRAGMPAKASKLVYV
jgi:intraflagellar transport protein 172